MRIVFAALFTMASASAHAVVGPSLEGGPLAAHVLMILKRSAKSAGFCSGVVIAPGIVLTAAHCVSNAANMKLHFRDNAGEPVLLDIAAVAVHPQYRADAQISRVRTVDLALVKSATALPASFAAAQLDDTGIWAVGDSFTLAGYGLSREGDGTTGGKLRSGMLEARAPVSQLLLWTRDAGNSGTGACTGDSGAPIFDASGTKIVAITAWADGAGKALCGSLTQGTLVAPVRGWIASVLQGWRQ